MWRNNITKKFQPILTHALTIIAAPDGYGKTTYLKDFISKEKLQNIWVEGKKEYTTNYLWNIILRDAIDQHCIPSQLENINLFSLNLSTASLLKQWDVFLRKPLCIVIDDFHKMKLPQLSSFFNFIKSCELKYLHFVMMGQYIDESTWNQIYNEKHCFTMSMNDFRFEYYDIARYFKKKGIDVDREQLEKLLCLTNGWGPAIDLAISSYLEGGSLFSTSKIDILLSKAKIEDMNDEDIIAFIKLAYFDEFTIEQMRFICDNEHSEKRFVQLSYNHLFVQKNSFKYYSFSPMLKAYLYEAQMIYAIDEQETCQKIAYWYIEKGEFIYALQYLLKGRCFETIVHMMNEGTFNGIDIPVPLLDEVFQRMPIRFKYEHPYVYLYYIKCVVIYVDSFKGRKMLDNFKVELELRKYTGDIDSLMGEYYYIRALSKFNNFFRMGKDFKLASEHLKKHASKIAYPEMLTTFGSYQLLYLYHHEEGQLKATLANIKECAKYLVHLTGGEHAGIEYLVQGEYNYAIGRYEEVESIVLAAYKVTNINKQISLGICALFLLCRNALLKKDENNAMFYVEQLNGLYVQTQSRILHYELDCALSHLAILDNRFEDVKDWIKEGNFKENVMMHEAKKIPYLCNMLYLVKTHKYQEAEAICDMLDYENQNTSFVFNRIYAKMCKVIVYYHTGRVGKSNLVLKEVLDLAQKDKVITLFVEFYELLLPILKKYKCENEFEQKIYRMLIEQYNMNHNDINNILDTLSKREKEVALLYAKSYTAQEIGEKLVISYNTVLTHLKIIYSKLNINKKKELISLLKELD